MSATIAIPDAVRRFVLTGLVFGGMATDFIGVWYGFMGLNTDLLDSLQTW